MTRRQHTSQLPNGHRHVDVSFEAAIEAERRGDDRGVPTFLVRGDVYYWGSLAVACLITGLPIALLYSLFLDRFIAGITVGAVK